MAKQDTYAIKLTLDNLNFLDELPLVVISDRSNKFSFYKTNLLSCNQFYDKYILEECIFVLFAAVSQ